MKIYRKPSIKKSISARTTGKWTRAVKRKIIPGYGKKGMGYIKNPRRAFLNKGYYQITRGVFSSSKSRHYRKENKLGIIIILLIIWAISHLFKGEENSELEEINVVNESEEINVINESEESESSHNNAAYSMKRHVGEDSKLRDAPECFGIDNFLYNYEEIAVYGLGEDEVNDLKEHYSDETTFSRITNYPLSQGYYMTGTNSSLCGYEVRIQFFYGGESEQIDEQIQNQIIYDCIHAIDANVPDERIDYEINTIRQTESTTAYFNERFEFTGSLTSLGTISFTITYNPIHNSIHETNWGYSDYEIPNYR